MECLIPLADRAQGHVDRLLDEVAVVVGCAFDEIQTLEKRLIARLLVIHGQTPQQRKGRAFLEFAALAAPLRDLGPGMRRAVEQVEAQRVAHRPVVEFPAPAVHLRGGESCRITDERCQQARLVHAGVPQGGCEFVVASKLLAERLDVLHRHAIGLVRRDGIACHAIQGGLGPVGFQPLQRRPNFIIDRGLRFLSGLVKRGLEPLGQEIGGRDGLVRHLVLCGLFHGKSQTQ